MYLGVFYFQNNNSMYDNESARPDPNPVSKLVQATIRTVELAELRNLAESP